MNQIITLTSSTGFHSSAKKPPAGASTILLGPKAVHAAHSHLSQAANVGVHHRIMHALTASFFMQGTLRPTLGACRCRRRLSWRSSLHADQMTSITR